MKFSLAIWAGVLAMVLGGCVQGRVWPHSTTFVSGERPVRTYHYRNHSTTANAAPVAITQATTVSHFHIAPLPLRG